VEEAESINCAAIMCLVTTIDVLYLCNVLGRLKLVNNTNVYHYLTNRHILNTDVRTPVAFAPRRIHRDACWPE